MTKSEVSHGLVILTEEILNGKLPFLCSYNKEIDEGYLLKVDVQYTEKLHQLNNDLPFLFEKKKIEKAL